MIKPLVPLDPASAIVVLIRSNAPAGMETMLHPRYVRITSHTYDMMPTSSPRSPGGDFPLSHSCLACQALEIAFLCWRSSNLAHLDLLQTPTYCVYCTLTYCNPRWGSSSQPITLPSAWRWGGYFTYIATDCPFGFREYTFERDKGTRTYAHCIRVHRLRSYNYQYLFKLNYASFGLPRQGAVGYAVDCAGGCGFPQATSIPRFRGCRLRLSLQ